MIESKIVYIISSGDIWTGYSYELNMKTTFTISTTDRNVDYDLLEEKIICCSYDEKIFYKHLRELGLDKKNDLKEWIEDIKGKINKDYL